jgi:hypothetical protein
MSLTFMLNWNKMESKSSICLSKSPIHKAVGMLISSRDHLSVIFLAQTHGKLGRNFISAVTIAVPYNVNDKRDDCL